MARHQWLTLAVVVVHTRIGAADVESGLHIHTGSTETDGDGSVHLVEGSGKRDLVLVHTPMNFGHTIEKVAYTNNDPTVKKGEFWSYAFGSERNQTLLETLYRPGGVVWGAANASLTKKSAIGCAMYLTPPRMWPKSLAASYYGNKTGFGMLRDPYERLVAIFRGNLGSEYGGTYQEFYSTCDVNGAVNKMLDNAAKNPYENGCVFLPSAEYFTGDYAATLPVDNTLFPTSMNSVFHQHGYNWTIHQRDIIHVSGCDNIWAGNLTKATKKRIQLHFARDFDMRCKHFGRCDYDEVTCLKGIKGMCPSYIPDALVRKSEKEFKEDVAKVIDVASEL